jgi:hypothetical protein
VVPAIDHVEADRGVALIEDDSLEAAADDVVARQSRRPHRVVPDTDVVGADGVVGDRRPAGGRDEKDARTKVLGGQIVAAGGNIALVTGDRVVDDGRAGTTTTTPFEAIFAVSPGPVTTLSCASRVLAASRTSMPFFW